MAMISPSKTNIQEANKHLQMVHARVKELERNLTKQTHGYAQRDQEKQVHFEELLKIKDAEIEGLKTRNKKAEDTISEMKLKLRESQKVLMDMQEKGRVLDEILQCKPILQSMVKLMDVYQACESDSVLSNMSLSQEEASLEMTANEVNHKGQLQTSDSLVKSKGSTTSHVINQNGSRELQNGHPNHKTNGVIDL